jgi:hypothetical protein
MFTLHESPVVDSDSSNTCCSLSHSLKILTPDLKLFPDFLLFYTIEEEEEEKEKNDDC